MRGAGYIKQVVDHSSFGGLDLDTCKRIRLPHWHSVVSKTCLRWLSSEKRCQARPLHREDEEKLPVQPSAGPGSQSFARKLFETAESELLYSLPVDGPNNPKVRAINLATLQRVRLHAIRYEISESVERWYSTKGDVQFPRSASIDEQMHTYCNALRDLDYMRVRGGSDKTNDPFIITSSHELDRTLLYELDLVGRRSGAQKKTPRAQDHDDPQLIERSRTEWNAEEKLKAFVQRIQGAALGIAALFGPVLIMIFAPTLTATLATAFAFVVLVTVGLAAMPDMSPKDVLGLSFAYAAVLVVFIGTGLAPTT